MARNIICAMTLIAIVLFCYARSLTSYFLADDLGEVQYIYKIFHGHSDLFWSNFTGNYMQVPGMAVYRPFLLVSLVIDYLFWKGNAFGYYLSNVLSFAGCAIVLFLIMRKLTGQISHRRSFFVSFFSAALFALSPLHPESISWIVGRVDVNCCLFYLLSFLFWLNYIQITGRRWLLLSIICFISGLLIKEMAIGLPVLAFAFCYFRPDRTEDLPGDRHFVKTIIQAVKISLPLWLATALYFVVRYLALGTLTGGYEGSIGASQLGNMLVKWSDLDTIRRVFYPLNYAIFQNRSILSVLFSCAYSLILLTAAIRLLFSALSWRFIGFLAVWLFTTMLPIYKLWGLGYNLEGARFYFFLTVPLSVLFAYIAFCPWPLNMSINTRKWLNYITVFAILVLSYGYYKAAYQNNLCWVHAGHEVRACVEQSLKLADGLADGEKVLLLGLPKDNHGAHMILNGSSFLQAISPPFFKDVKPEKFVLCEPILFGNEEVVDALRLRRYLNDRRVKGPYVWSREKKQFVLTRFSNFELEDNSVNGVVEKELPLPDLTDSSPSCVSSAQLFVPEHGCISPGADKEILLTNLAANDGLTWLNANVNVFEDAKPCFDYLQLEVEAKDGNASRPVSVKAVWNQFGAEAKQSRNLFVKEELHTPFTSFSCPKGVQKVQIVNIPLSRAWKWFSCSNISDIGLQFDFIRSLSLRSAKLLPATSIEPVLSVYGQENSCTQFIKLDEPGKLRLRIDATQIKEASKLKLEIGKAHFFFANLDSDVSGNNSIQDFLCIEKIIDGLTYNGQIDTARMKEAGLYQIRVCALADNGERIGEYSYPLTLDWSK